jgi:transposase
MKPPSLIERVYAFCNSNWERGKKFIVNHFTDENTPEATIYRLIKRWESGIPSSRKPGSGRPAKIMTRKNIERLKDCVNDQTGVATRELGQKFKCDHSYIVKTLKNKTDIRYRKRIKVPFRTEAQKEVCQPRCRRILLKNRHREVIMDDESYFTLSNSDKNSNAGFWTNDVQSTPDEVKFKTKQKYEQKAMLWIAISPRGISQPFLVPSGLAVNQHIYLKECIIKRLIPFIKKYHSDDNYVFWPDLASSHYAKSVISHLREEKVNFVEKEDNPPCVPELRPIENFFSILKGIVYKKGWEAQSVDQLKKRIKYCLKKVDLDLVHRMFSDVPSKLDRARRNGIPKPI